jgi:hypothetical protein
MSKLTFPEYQQKGEERRGEEWRGEERTKKGKE